MSKRSAIELGEALDDATRSLDAKKIKLFKTPEEIEQLSTRLSEAIKEYKPEDGDTKTLMDKKLHPLLKEGASPYIIKDLAFEHRAILDYSDMLELMVSYMDNVKEESDFSIIPAMSNDVRDDVIISAIKKNADVF